MHPLNNGSQVENVPALKPRVGTAGYFSESNDNGAPSYPGQDWFNAVIREFQTALPAMGVVFDPDKFDHLARALSSVNPSWNAFTDFAVGRQCVKNGKRYNSVQPSGPNNGGYVDPESDSDWSHWQPDSGTVFPIVTNPNGWANGTVLSWDAQYSLSKFKQIIAVGSASFDASSGNARIMTGVFLPDELVGIGGIAFEYSTTVSTTVEVTLDLVSNTGCTVGVNGANFGNLRGIYGVL